MHHKDVDAHGALKETGPVPHRDYPPVESRWARALRYALDLALTIIVVAIVSGLIYLAAEFLT